MHDWDARFDTLTAAVTNAIARGRDNELFVLMLDMVDYPGSLERLKQIVRLARATDFTRLVARVQWLGIDPRIVLRTVEMLADKVLPLVERALA